MHLINELLLESYDYRRPEAQKMSYMIATIPRSGSTYFALELWRTGALGAPMEYLNIDAMADYFLPRFGITKKENELDQRTIKNYWSQVKLLRTSPNGVFGYKMFMITFHQIINSFPSILDDIIPDYIIYLTRQDSIAQAISYSRAKLTQAWFADAASLSKANYSYEHISQCKKEIQVQCTYWESVFSMADIEPIRITYEDLMQDRNRIVHGILEELGLEQKNLH